MPVAEGFELTNPVFDSGSDPSDVWLAIPQAWNQFMGQPINQATHVGFKLPPICSDSGLLLRSIVASLAFPDFQSLAVGVANAFTAVANPSPLVALAPLRLWLPQTVGVGHLT